MKLSLLVIGFNKLFKIILASKFRIITIIKKCTTWMQICPFSLIINLKIWKTKFQWTQEM